MYQEIKIKELDIYLNFSFLKNLTFCSFSMLYLQDLNCHLLALV